MFSSAEDNMLKRPLLTSFTAAIVFSFLFIGVLGPAVLFVFPIFWLFTWLVLNAVGWWQDEVCRVSDKDETLR